MTKSRYCRTGEYTVDSPAWPGGSPQHSTAEGISSPWLLPVFPHLLKFRGTANLQFLAPLAAYHGAVVIGIRFGISARSRTKQHNTLNALAVHLIKDSAEFGENWIVSVLVLLVMSGLQHAKC